MKVDQSVVVGLKKSDERDNCLGRGLCVQKVHSVGLTAIKDGIELSQPVGWDGIGQSNLQALFLKS